MSAPVSVDGPSAVPVTAPVMDDTRVATQVSTDPTEKRRMRGKRGGKQHRKRVPTHNASSGVFSDDTLNISRDLSSYPPRQPGTGASSPAGGGNIENAASSAVVDGSQPAAAPTDTDDVKMDNVKKRRRAHRRAKRNPNLKYAEMTVAQKLRFDAKQSRRRLNDASVKVPTDKRGRIKKGIHLLDYQPNAPRYTLPTTGDLRVDLSSSSDEEESDDDLDEFIGAATVIPIQRLDSGVTSDGGSLARRDSIDTLNDSDLDFGSDLPAYNCDEFQPDGFGTSDLTEGQPVESATIDQLKETVLQLRTVKREMHDRLKAAELESIHLRRKLEAAVQKLRNLRAKASKDKQQRKGASKPGKPKPAKPT